MLIRAGLLAGVLLTVFFLLLLPVEALRLQQEGKAGNDLPEGEGKELVGKICIMCHALDVITTGRKRTRGEWEMTVDRMISNGAPISAAEAKTIVAYLNQNFGSESKPPAETSDPGKAAGPGDAQKDEESPR